MKNKVILLAGPTAGGKSALALALAEQTGGAIVNADSMQVYRELRVMTARPSPAEEARVPHYLYGYRTADEPSSAAAWSADATMVIERLWAEGRLPIVVGGTGLYFRTLWQGMSPIPEVPEDIRQAVRRRAAASNETGLHDELTRRDPKMAARLQPGDRQRVARALEVLDATGRSLGEWQRLAPTGGLAQRADVEALRLVLVPPRDELYARCDARLVWMMTEAGGLDEIRELLESELSRAQPVMKALGVPEFASHLQGWMGFDEALVRAQAATRQYAKRQMTWFRHQFAEWTSGDKKFMESLLANDYSFRTK